MQIKAGITAVMMLTRYDQSSPCQIVLNVGIKIASVSKYYNNIPKEIQALGQKRAVHGVLHVSLYIYACKWLKSSSRP